jgi:tetratricopeptide (TPR) repeat protein
MRPHALGTSLVLAAFLFLVSCGDPGAAFRAGLDRLDADLAAGQPSAPWASDFGRAARKARSAEDWVSLLARARKAESLGDKGRYAELAFKALSKGPKDSAELGMAEADAMLRSGRPAEALELFGASLSAEEKPGLWAEAMVAALRDGSLPGRLRLPGNFGRLAAITGEARFYLDAAALSLVAGDRLGAGSWLKRAMAAGLEPPAGLLWDAGLYAELSGLADGKPSASRRLLMADAAWMMGDAASASRRWDACIRLDPLVSWRPYASLAALSGGLLPTRARALGAFAEDGDFREADDEELRLEAGEASRSARSAHYYEAMARAFPDDAGARTARAAALARAGRTAEARSILGEAPPEADARTLREWLGVGAEVWPEGRLTSEAIRMAAAHPLDSGLVQEAMVLLLDRGYYDDFLALWEGAGRRGLEYPLRPLLSVYAALATGGGAAALALLDAGGPGLDGVEGHFARAVIKSDSGDFSGAEASLKSALNLAAGPALRCRILKALGQAADGQGDRRKAAGYYAQAHVADPADTEAARLANR